MYFLSLWTKFFYVFECWNDVRTRTCLRLLLESVSVYTFDFEEKCIQKNDIQGIPVWHVILDINNIFVVKVRMHIFFLIWYIKWMFYSLLIYFLCLIVWVTDECLCLDANDIFKLDFLSAGEILRFLDIHSNAFVFLM